MNRVMLSGSVATTPTRVSPNVVIFRMVVYDKYNAKEKKYVTDLVPIKVRGKLAEFVEKRLEVGQEVEIIGKMKSKKTDKKLFCDVIAYEIRPMHKSLKKLFQQKTNN